MNIMRTYCNVTGGDRNGRREERGRKEGRKREGRRGVRGEERWEREERCGEKRKEGG